MRSLGIDTGVRTFGWAVAETGRGVIDLGVIVEDKHKRELVNAGRARRIRAQAELVRDLAASCEVVVIEQLSFPPGVVAAASCAASWGAMIGACIAVRYPRVLAIGPKAWQGMMLTDAVTKSGSIDYERVVVAMERIILAETRSPVARAYLGITKSNRTHAIDAAGLALVGLLRPEGAEQISPGSPDLHRVAREREHERDHRGEEDNPPGLGNLGV